MGISEGFFSRTIVLCVRERKKLSGRPQGQELFKTVVDLQCIDTPEGLAEASFYKASCRCLAVVVEDESEKRHQGMERDRSPGPSMRYFKVVHQRINFH